MAATPTQKPTPNKRPVTGAQAVTGLNLPNPALAALDPLSVLLPVGVAYSGGADSTALLHAAAQRWPGQVVALHVHHGLQAAADEFVRVCEETCQRLGVPIHVLRVRAGPAAGQSPEDAARLARYAALAQAATDKGLQAVLLGQHADDQVETLLLALSRGAGLPGLSAMAAQFERAGMRFHRPLLHLPAADLRHWLLREAIAFVDDPTNSDESYTRNRIRARLLPALQQTFPQFRETFARSARHAAQAQTLLVELATEDLARVGVPPQIKALQGLSGARQGNVLRHWLLTTHQATPSAAQLEQLLGQVAACTTRGHRIELKVADGQVTRDRDTLAYAARPSPG
ncbi:MAG: tRNA lysidine(34) synthetase TilS [Burkholderiales bacterium]|nr:MAG: tRNA lysidine(34) synthetase TilS [Burkholderiales bacterium]